MFPCYHESFCGCCQFLSISSYTVVIQMDTVLAFLFLNRIYLTTPSIMDVYQIQALLLPAFMENPA
jgi:hypothetical protein